ncbi:MAG: response regulator transcription factor [Candidatus Eremiobacteraeota bacterium]|nr:response regulator transcription factor [Candidatus Eremiobacteraeota bacterium]
MSLASSQPDVTSVFVAGADSAVRSAVARLLQLDPAITVLGASDAPVADKPNHVVVDESLLAELQDLPIAHFIAAVKSLAATPLRARHLQPVPSGNDMRALLSERELQVVKLVAEGLSNKEISLRLRLSDKTVKNHISHILAKLQLTARTQVAVHALRAGIV